MLHGEHLCNNAMIYLQDHKDISFGQQLLTLFSKSEEGIKRNKLSDIKDHERSNHQKHLDEVL